MPDNKGIIMPNGTLKPVQNTDSTDKKDGKQRIRLKFDVEIDYDALKSLEKKTMGSFLELVNKVILVDKKPFGEATYINSNGKEQHYKLTTGRKKEYTRIIEHYALLEFNGNKCYVVKVFDKSEREKLEETLLQNRIDKIQNRIDKPRYD